jgi:hypothetical protein
MSLFKREIVDLPRDCRHLEEGDNRCDNRKTTHRSLFANQYTPEHPVDSIGNQSH